MSLYILQPITRSYSERICLKNGSNIIGRSNRCHFSLKTALAGELHCNFEVDENQVNVIGLDETHSTFVNGNPVKPGHKTRLNLNDTIGIGTDISEQALNNLGGSEWEETYLFRFETVEIVKESVTISDDEYLSDATVEFNAPEICPAIALIDLEDDEEPNVEQPETSNALTAKNIVKPQTVPDPKEDEQTKETNLTDTQAVFVLSEDDEQNGAEELETIDIQIAESIIADENLDGDEENLEDALHEYTEELLNQSTSMENDKETAEPDAETKIVIEPVNVNSSAVKEEPEDGSSDEPNLNSESSDDESSDDMVMPNSQKEPVLTGYLNDFISNKNITGAPEHVPQPSRSKAQMLPNPKRKETKKRGRPKSKSKCQESDEDIEELVLDRIRLSMPLTPPSSENERKLRKLRSRANSKPNYNENTDESSESDFEKRRKKSKRSPKIYRIKPLIEDDSDDEPLASMVSKPINDSTSSIKSKISNELSIKKTEPNQISISKPVEHISGANLNINNTKIKQLQLEVQPSTSSNKRVLVTDALPLRPTMRGHKNPSIISKEPANTSNGVAKVTPNRAVEIKKPIYTIPATNIHRRFNANKTNKTPRTKQQFQASHAARKDKLFLLTQKPAAEVVTSVVPKPKSQPKIKMGMSRNEILFSELSANCKNP